VRKALNFPQVGRTRVKTRLLASAILTSIATGALAAPNQYLCITDQAAGLHYDRQTGAWLPQAFSNRTKYILRRLNENDWNGPYHYRLEDQEPHPTWGFFEFGDDMPQAVCDETFSFSCHHVLADLVFNKDSLRFQVTHHEGYISQGYWRHLQSTDPEGYQLQKLQKLPGTDPISRPDDLFFEIGTCSPF
jgi:hypothetical protein